MGYAKYLLRSLDTANQGLTNQDKILLIRKGTNSGSTLSVDLSNIVRKGATVSYFQFKQEATDSSGLLSADADVAGASEDVMVLIVVDQADLALGGD